MPKVFGLDIGSDEIKALQAEKSSVGYKLEHFASVPYLGDEKEKIKAIKAAVVESGINSSIEVNVALAESDVYTRIVETPKLSETELASSIHYEAEQYVPVPLEEVELYHQVLSSDELESEKSMKVLLIAVTKKKLEQLTRILDEAGLIPKSLETELFAAKRVLPDEGKYQLLISFNLNTTDIMVINKGLPIIMHSIGGGGLAMTKMLASELNLSLEQAEQYKRTYGMEPKLLEGKVAQLIKPIVDNVLADIGKSLTFLTQGGLNKPLDQVVLVGGGALLPGMTSYIVEKLNTEVIVADPFGRFVKDDKFNKLVTGQANPQLATVVGLAVKNI